MPFETFPFRIDHISWIMIVNPLCQRSVNPIKIFADRGGGVTKGDWLMYFFHLVLYLDFKKHTHAAGFSGFYFIFWEFSCEISGKNLKYAKNFSWKFRKNRGGGVRQKFAEHLLIWWVPKRPTCKFFRLSCKFFPWLSMMHYEEFSVSSRGRTSKKDCFFAILHACTAQKL